MKKPNKYSEYKCPSGKSSPQYGLPKDVVIGRYCRNNCGEYRKCKKWIEKEK